MDYESVAVRVNIPKGFDLSTIYTEPADVDLSNWDKQLLWATPPFGKKIYTSYVYDGNGGIALLPNDWLIEPIWAFFNTLSSSVENWVYADLHSYDCYHSIDQPGTTFDANHFVGVDIGAFYKTATRVKDCVCPIKQIWREGHNDDCIYSK